MLTFLLIRLVNLFESRDYYHHFLFGEDISVAFEGRIDLSRIVSTDNLIESTDYRMGNPKGAISPISGFAIVSTDGIRHYMQMQSKRASLIARSTLYYILRRS